MRATKAERVATGTQHFNGSNLGLAMSDLSRRVLGAQDFPAIVERRRRNYTRLLAHLRDLSPPIFGDLPAGVCPLFYPFRVQNSEAVMARLKARGVGAGSVWSISHPVAPPGAFPEIDELRQTVLWLPCHQDLTPPALDRVAEAVYEVVQSPRV
jgi:dTDP-4-amino-4,6-dideoxygalactose transaminase